MCVTTHIRSMYTVAYPEFQRGGAVLGGGRKGGPLLVRYECVCVCVCVGGGAVRFKSDTKSGGLWHTANSNVVVIINN